MKQQYIYISFFLVVFFFSCKTPQTIIRKREIKNISPQLLYDSLVNNYGEIQDFSGKFKATITRDKKTTSVAGLIKIKNDSVIWASVNPGFGIEVARVLLRPDSAYLIDRLNSTFYKGEYSYIEKLANIETNYFAIQAIFLNTLPFFASIDTAGFFNSAVIKKENNGKFIELENNQKRIIKKGGRKMNLPTIFEKIKIDNTTLKISEIFLKDFKEDREVIVNYSDFAYSDVIKTDFPQIINIRVIQNNNSYTITIKFTKQQFNVLNEYQFSIPESYKPIDIKR